MTVRNRILAYLALLLPSFLLVACLWAAIAPDHLYHCWDDAPPFVISWFPPFIHPWANSPEGNLRDYYIWPGWSVYTIWVLLIAIAFSLPAVLICRKDRRRRLETETAT